MKRILVQGRALVAVALVLLPCGCGEQAPPGKDVKKESTSRLEPIRKAAEQGDASAQRKLGQAYYDGQGVAQDYAESAAWYRRAAKQGDAKAQFMLASYLAKGRGVEQDSVEAYKWYKLAALNGNPEADAARSILRRDMTPEQITEGKKLVAEATPKKSSAKSR